MTMPINLHPQYITDDSGDKVSVIITIEEFENMLEDIEDLTAIADRKNENTTSHKKFLEELKSDGTL
ncbi:MAG: hypothetical protein COA30_06900 [Sulfurimonas sp.]|nr:hypothetical protein [Sulfurimonas sp.]PHQ55370.1 MAG: hypothetical protein COA30_06900 [Sulfurimonas sp.]